MGQLAGWQGQVLITQTPAVAITDEALTDSGDHTTFSEATATHRYWDKNTALVFQTSTDGSTWNTATPANIQHTGGLVTFSGAVGGTHQARIHSGAYLPYTPMLEVTSWKFQGQRDMKDVTSLSGPGATDRSKKFLSLLLSGTLTLAKWWQTEVAEVTGLLNLLTTGAWCVVSLVTPSSNRYEGYVYLKTDAINDPVNDVVSRALTFQFAGNFYAV